MRKKFKIKVGDQVGVIAGNHKGKTGKVVQILKKSDRIVIEGVNMLKKHQKPSATNPEGGIKEVEGSIHISNVLPLDNAGNPVRVGYKFDEKGNKIRIAKKTGEEIK